MFSKTERDICHIIYDAANVIAVISPKRSRAASYLHVGAQECAHSSTMVKRSQLALRTYVGKRLNCISSSSSPSVSLKRPIQFPRVWKQLLPIQGSSVSFDYIYTSQKDEGYLDLGWNFSIQLKWTSWQVNFSWLFLEFWMYTSNYCS